MDDHFVVANTILAAVNAIAILCIVGVVVFLARSSARLARSKSAPTHREYTGMGMRVLEKFERDTVSMSLGVEIEPEKKVFVINAQGGRDDVKELSMVLSELIPNGSFTISTRENSASDVQAAVQFVVIRHKAEGSSNLENLSFKRLDQTWNGTDS